RALSAADTPVPGAGDGGAGWRRGLHAVERFVLLPAEAWIRPGADLDRAGLRGQKEVARHGATLLWWTASHLLPDHDGGRVQCPDPRGLLCVRRCGAR